MENNKKNEDRRFYIYEHIRKDNNTCFYVGKGTGDRAYNLDRGNFHNGVCKQYGCIVKIIKDGLTEKEAFALERERIEDYVITFGYGAPIDGYRDYSNNYLTNFTWGGEGTSGMNPYANKTEEEMKTISKKKSEAHKGEKNAMFGKKGKDSPIYGEKNGMWGKHHSKETIEKLNKKVICTTTGEIFDSQKQAAIHYKVARSHISNCCKEKRKSAGKLQDGTRLQWKYVKDYNNEFKGILINPIINN